MTRPEATDNHSRRAKLAVLTAAVAAVAAGIINFLPPLGVQGGLAVADAVVWAALWVAWGQQLTENWTLEWVIRGMVSLAALGLLVASVLSLTKEKPTSDGLPPFAAIPRSSVQRGRVPLRVVFSAADSRPSGSAGPLAYAWDLDGNGQFADATTVTTVRDYEQPGTYLVRVKVTDVKRRPSVSDPVEVVALPARKTVPPKPPATQAFTYPLPHTVSSWRGLRLGLGPWEPGEGNGVITRLRLTLARSCSWDHVPGGAEFEITDGTSMYIVDVSNVDIGPDEATLVLTRRTVQRQRFSCQHA
jgi:hypothetical protein